MAALFAPLILYGGLHAKSCTYAKFLGTLDTLGISGNALIISTYVDRFMGMLVMDRKEDYSIYEIYE